MSRRLMGSVAVGAAVCCWFVVVGLYAQSQEPAHDSAAEFRKSVLPVLSKHCFGCHSDRLKTADLSFEIFRDPNLALKRPQIWDKVREKLMAGRQPAFRKPSLRLC
jgi:hypothetical protein